MEVIHKIGRRKTAVARVYLAKEKENYVNKKDIKDYFPYCNFTVQSKPTFSID